MRGRGDAEEYMAEYGGWGDGWLGCSLSKVLTNCLAGPCGLCPYCRLLAQISHDGGPGIWMCGEIAKVPTEAPAARPVGV